MAESEKKSTPDVTGRLARYMAQAHEQQLAPHVAREALHRIPCIASLTR